jgi:hypothetical protein
VGNQCNTLFLDNFLSEEEPFEQGGPLVAICQFVVWNKPRDSRIGLAGIYHSQEPDVYWSRPKPSFTLRLLQSFAYEAIEESATVELTG